MAQIQPRRVDRQEQMRYSTVPGQLPELVPPLRQPPRFPLHRGHEFHGVEGGRVRYHRLPRLDDAAVLQTHAHGTSALDEYLVDVRVQLQLAPELLEAALQRVAELARPPDRDRERGGLLEEPLEDVQEVRRHGTLGGETAEYAHGVDEVAQEGYRHVLIDGLRQIVEGEGQVGEYVGVG